MWRLDVQMLYQGMITSCSKFAPEFYVEGSPVDANWFECLKNKTVRKTFEH